MAVKKRPDPTNREYTLRDEDFIVSKTDTRGIITYANAEFLKVAGYTEAELIGKSHNIVRHPDMPKAGFKSLWDTIKQGKEWRGIVKNLAKDGGFYWVEALVTPSYEDGNIIGYMSVRRKPSAEQVKEAEELYRKLRDAEKKSA